MSGSPKSRARGVVAAGDVQTARAGAQILVAGGNAVDAAVAAALAACVCEAPLISPAGAGLLLHGGPDDPFEVQDFFARVPGLGGRPAALDFVGVEVDFGGAHQTFHVGRGAAAVPGLLRGLVDVHRRRGRLPLADVVAPARDLADGYTVSAAVAGIFRLLAPIFDRTPEARRLACGDEGEVPAAGDRRRNAGLGRLLSALARDSDDALRAVEADLVASLGPAQGGLLSAADLAAFTPTRRAPVAVPFAGGTVLTPSAPSAGGGLVAVGLRLAERTGLTRRPLGEHWAQLAQVISVVDGIRRAEYDRRYTEPGFIERALRDDAIDAAWRDHAPRRGEAAPGLGGTTHISVLDGMGGVASMTASNGEGSGHVLETWGVHVNNFLGEEDINPRGFHAAPAGEPMMTMMTPAVFLRDGAPVLALGSGGSNRIRSAVLQGLLNHIAFGEPLAQALSRGRLHVEGARLWFEAVGMGEAAARHLEATWPGAARFDYRSLFFGGVHVAAHENGRYFGAGDPRRDGVAVTAEDAA